jgi:hypothetical protein
MVAVTLFFSFSSISFPSFFWSPFVLFLYSDVQLDVPVTWQVSLDQPQQTCAPRSRRLSNRHVLDAGHSTLVRSGYTWPGELCRWVLSLCAYRVKPDFSQGRCGRVNSILEEGPFGPFHVSNSTEAPIVIAAAVFSGVFFPPFLWEEGEGWLLFF